MIVRYNTVRQDLVGKRWSFVVGDDRETAGETISIYFTRRDGDERRVGNLARILYKIGTTLI